MIFLRTVSLLWLALSTASLSAAPVAAPALRLHWLGLNQISTDTNAAQLLKIWRLPETQTLAQHTLDKLSSWLAAGPTNAAVAKLRPLLDDLLDSEFYLQVLAPTNPPTPAAAAASLSGLRSPVSSLTALLAIRLPAARAAFWHTNLAAAPFAPVQFTRAGAWTVLGAGREAHDRLPAFVQKLLPHPAPANQNWLEADIEPAKLAAGWNQGASGFKSQTSGFGFLTPATCNLQPSTLQSIHLALAATNGEIFTHATATLSAPWTNALPAWDIPTNLLHDSLSSLTAARGLAPWLAALPAWQKTGFTPAPDQAFAWAGSGIPFQTYAAFPLPAASNQLTQLSARLLQHGNPWLTRHAQGNFEWNPRLPGLVWNGALIINPFLTTAAVHGQPWLLAGLYPRNPQDASPAPPAILRPLHDDPALVYYQAEQTGARADAGFFILQLFRVVFQKPQLPPAAPATVWLKHIEPDLGPGTTVVTRTGPREITLNRRSTLGLSALELHLLADWLESPSFPHGLHTFTAQPDGQ